LKKLIWDLNSTNQSYFCLWWPRFKVKVHRLLSYHKTEKYLLLKSMLITWSKYQHSQKMRPPFNYKYNKFQISVTIRICKAEIWKKVFESQIFHFRNSITCYTADLRCRKNIFGSLSSRLIVNMVKIQKIAKLKKGINPL
jgi:hypothetical protein